MFWDWPSVPSIQVIDTGEEAICYPFGEEIAKLVQERQKARQAKNYAEADRIRQELAKKGFRLIDKPNGETLVEVASE
jgi:cysteinyl-tRNA synthetase